MYWFSVLVIFRSNWNDYGLIIRRNNHVIYCRYYFGKTPYNQITTLYIFTYISSHRVTVFLPKSIIYILAYIFYSCTPFDTPY